MRSKSTTKIHYWPKAFVRTYRDLNAISLATSFEAEKNAEQRNKKRINERVCVWLCVFTGFSIILPLIETIYAKDMRVSQPQCQIEERMLLLRMLRYTRVQRVQYIKYET